MTTHDDIHRDLGRLEGISEGMQDHLRKIDATMERIDKRLANIEARERERKGAWQVIVVVAGAVGAAMATLANFLLGRLQ